MQKIDTFAARLPAERQASVYGGSKTGTEKRVGVLFHDYADPDALRRLAGQIKQHTLENLDTYLEQAVAALDRNGVHVHFASTAADARAITARILKDAGARSVMKSK